MTTTTRLQPPFPSPSRRCDDKNCHAPSTQWCLTIPSTRSLVTGWLNSVVTDATTTTNRGVACPNQTHHY